MKLKPYEIIQIILLILVVLLITNLLVETDIEQHAIDDFSRYLAIKRIIKVGFLSIITFMSIIFIEIRQHRITKKD